MEYDRPEDDESKGSRALVFAALAVAALAVVVIVVFYFGVYR